MPDSGDDAKDRSREFNEFMSGRNVREAKYVPYKGRWAWRVVYKSGRVEYHRSSTETTRID